jgi:GNAT superfamily N-acetyltransferase
MLTTVRYTDLSFENIMKTTVREAETRDFDFLEPHVYLRPEILRRKIEWGEFVIAGKDSEPVGFLQLEYLWSLVPYIALIRVLPEYQRQGIGRRMLKFAEDFLRDGGHRYIYSSSQADEAEPQTWHRHVGFEECGFIAGINEGTGEIFFRKKI